MRHNAIISNAPLADVVYLKYGYPFRGAMQSIPGGSAQVLQLKDITTDGIVNWSNLTKTDLPGRKDPEWLSDGDILLMARGTRTQAVYLSNVPEFVVCSPHFYILRVKSKGRLLPKFLCWQLNQKTVQSYFKNLGQGSSQHSLNRSLIESVEVVVPSIEKQIQILNLVSCAEQELAALEKLVQNRHAQLDFIAQNILQRT